MGCTASKILMQTWFVAALVLATALSGCTGQDAAFAANSPTNAAAPANTPAVAVQPEAQYPYQVIAALAKVYLQYNITDQAVRLFELAINQQYKQTGNEDAENWAGFGDALQKADRKEEAAKAYERALAIYETLFKQNTDAGRHNFYLQRLAAVNRVLGRDKEASAWLAQLKADEKSAAQQVALARIFEDQQDFAKAEVCYRRALDLTQADARLLAEVKIAYATMLNKSKRQDEAIALARDVAATEEASEETLKLAKRLLFEIHEARGELGKLEFK
ncbi:MAG: tetratricopeptide repeat protein [Planctomycetes bacterium]|nr:tetratricopeptide repeat protein [Planctomycetota bacterium]